MKNLAALLLALCLWAADAWQSKPFTEWSDKDIQKILTNSPWARAVTVATMGPSVASADSGGRGRGDGIGNRPAMDPTAGPGSTAPDGADGISGARGGRAGTGADEISPEAQAIRLTIRWQSALPVKQALARVKYGAEAATSPDAKRLIDQDSTYIIDLSGLAPTMARDLDRTKGTVKEQTSLASKGKDPLRPSEIVMGAPGKLMDAYFVFPKTATFTLDDKDVEFSTKLGSVAVKYKFHLKDMLYNGKLEL